MPLSSLTYCGKQLVMLASSESYRCFLLFHCKVSRIELIEHETIPRCFFENISGYTGKLSSIFRRQTAYKTDERIRLMDEIISGIQVIKMYAWEKPFAKLIKTARVKELKKVTKLSYVRGLFMTFNLFTPRVALFSALITIALTNQPITASTVRIEHLV